MLVDAVDGLHRGDKEAATAYLRFVEQHRGRAVAERARLQLGELRRAESWRHTQYWIANGYKPTNPPKEKKRWR